MSRAKSDRPFDEVHDIVRRIPSGRVMTYGQISQLIDRRLSAVGVGWALNQCPDDVPWQRVLNAKGGCSTDRRPDFAPGSQRWHLEEEGVEFEDDGTVDLERFRYTPRSRKKAPAKKAPAKKAKKTTAKKKTKPNAKKRKKRP